MHSPFCARQRIAYFVFAITALFTIEGENCRAGMVSPSNLIEEQSLNANMPALSLSDLAGVDSSTHFTFGRSFEQHEGNEAFRGMYSRQLVSESTAMSIIGDLNDSLTRRSGFGRHKASQTFIILVDRGNGKHALELERWFTKMLRGSTEKKSPKKSEKKHVIVADFRKNRA